MAKEIKLSGKERQALAFVFALSSIFRADTEILEKRIRAQGGTMWRDWCLCRSLVKKLENGLVDSLTYDDLVWEQRLLQHAKIGVDFPGPIRKPDYAIMDVRDLTLIASYAGHDQCTTCMKEGREVRNCKLRKTLLHTAPPPEGETDGSVCEYSSVDWDQIE